MKKVAILLLTALPFFGFSQNETNGFAYVKNPAMEVTPTKTQNNSKSFVAEKSNELPSYFEDDLKLYGGSQVLDMHPLETKENDYQTMLSKENPKVYYEVLISDTKVVTVREKKQQYNEK